MLKYTIYNFSQINIKLKLINDVCPKKGKNHNINAQHKTILLFNFMDSNPNLDEPKVLVNSSDLLKKFKTREDRYNFMRENSK